MTMTERISCDICGEALSTFEHHAFGTRRWTHSTEQCLAVAFKYIEELRQELRDFRFRKDYDQLAADERDVT